MKQVILILVGAVVCTGCVDSKVPLSDPQTAQPDSRLIGVWRVKGEHGEVGYYHLGQAGEDFPKGVFRVVGLSHQEGRLSAPIELLLFATQLEKRTYLNLVEGKPEIVKQIKEKGWQTVSAYWIWRYEVEGAKLTIWPMEREAKRRAIEEGKIRGEIVKDGILTLVQFTDTQENLARFVAQSGEKLFSAHPVQLERREAFTPAGPALQAEK